MAFKDGSLATGSLAAANQGAYLANVPFYHFLQVLFPIELVVELSSFIGFEVFWMLLGVVLLHYLKPIAGLGNATWPVFFVPSTKNRSIRDGNLPMKLCQNTNSVSIGRENLTDHFCRGLGE